MKVEVLLFGLSGPRRFRANPFLVTPKSKGLTLRRVTSGSDQPATLATRVRALKPGRQLKKLS